MTTGYEYLGVIWRTLVDAEEMVLAVFQGNEYNYFARIAYLHNLPLNSPELWDRMNAYWHSQYSSNRRRFKEVTIMD